MDNIIEMLKIIEDNYCFEINARVGNELLAFLSGLLKDRFFRIVENDHRKDSVLDLLGIGYIKILSNIFVYKGNEQEGILCNDIILNGDEIKSQKCNNFWILRDKKIICKELGNSCTISERPVYSNKVVVNDSFVYFRIQKFENGYTDKLKRLVVGKRKVIIDLRDNMGGEVLLANEFLRLFISTTFPIYFVKNQKQGERAIFFRGNKTIVNESKIYVLVNSYTASSAELVTTALKEHCEAQIIGEKTYGKGVMLKRIHMTETKDILMPVFEFYTKNIKINNAGIIPDIRADEKKIDAWIADNIAEM